MYKRCIFDKTGLEPRSLFNLVEFIMYDKENRQEISVENTLELIYVKCTKYVDKDDEEKKDMTQEIESLFG